MFGVRITEPAAMSIHLQLLCCICILWLILHPLSTYNCAYGLSLVFNYSHLVDNSASTVPLQMQAATTRNSSGAYWLTPDPNVARPSKENQTQGRLLFNRPLQFKARDDGQDMSSFSTTFSFQIITPGAYGYCGDGLAFFMAPTIDMPLASGGHFMGIANGTLKNQPARHLFAVEFDTYQNKNLNDISSSHIGINIDGMESTFWNDTTGDGAYELHGPHPELFLYSNHTFTAWVEYDALNQFITVWATNKSGSGVDRPSNPCLQGAYDLSIVFKKEMYIGLSASSGDSYEGHVVLSWDFSMEYTSNAPAPAPTSAPNFQSSPSSLQGLPFIEHGHRKGHTGLVAGSVSGVIVFAFVLSCLFVILKKKSRGAPTQIPPSQDARQATHAGIQLPSNILAPRFSYRDLKRATNGFSDKNKIGEGASGSVYKATLPDTSIVAVKWLKDGPKKEAVFLAEIQIISGIRHRNLLQLRGWCYDSGQAFLVYDYMPNGSLEKYIFHSSEEITSSTEERRYATKYLDSETRLEILKGVASALEYLHGGLGSCVLHRDVKAANVMLTERFEAMVGDFGLARLITRNKAVTMTVVGTTGYVAPELLATKKATDKADVYSFGVLALEVACGRATLNAYLPSQEISLVDWVWKLKQRNKLMEALEPALLEEISDQGGNDTSELEKWRCVLHVGLKSCQPFPESRPSMRQIYQALEEIIIFPLPTSQPMLYPMAPSQTSFHDPTATSTSGEASNSSTSFHVDRSSDGSLSSSK